ncbi:MAG: hypothetical protein A3E88_08065 [Legionellales bacterium RIFCSPHIGHO2_12_FULL_35_11]|nr:MAG: hypothetical protein A3E88_08065 [Legionellales bacterium RIFCSPHIGHO2_12_FULL_35_11]
MSEIEKNLAETAHAAVELSDACLEIISNFPNLPSKIRQQAQEIVDEAIQNQNHIQQTQNHRLGH